MKNVVFIKDFEDNQEIPEAIYWGYQKSKESGNALLDFSDVIHADKIPEIAEMLRSAGVQEFTISLPSGDILEEMTAFKECGFKVYDIVKVKANYRDFKTKEFKVIPAVLMKIE